MLIIASPYTRISFIMFGNQQQQAGGLFGSSQNQQGGSSLFGSAQNTQQPSTGGLFSGLGQSNQQNKPPGAFGSVSSTQQQPSGGLFSNLNQGNQQQQSTGGLFGGLGQQQQNQSLGASGIGQNAQQQQNGGNSLFSNLGQSTQQQPQANSFGHLNQSQALPPLGQSTSLWQPNSAVNPRMYSQSPPLPKEANFYQAKRVYLSKFKPSPPNGTVTTPIVSSNTTSITKYPKVASHSTNLHQTKIPRHGRRRCRRNLVLV